MLAGGFVDWIMTEKIDGLDVLETELSWDDLVLDEDARREVEQIAAWLRHQAKLLEDWRLKRFLRPSYRVLFGGAPGTGKHLTAALLGKTGGVPVYRIDPSRLISKVGGHPPDSILVLDDVREGRDRAANQQTAALLQRLEDFPGVVILVATLRDHLDEAFSRRFQSVIHFSMPTVDQRLRLWRMHFADQTKRLADDVDFAALARAYELAGGDIAEILRLACLRAVTRVPAEITQKDLLDGIRRRSAERKPKS
jgi:SpoVK/Ycf46/Vps4 family AAA+-type ATPase